MNVQPTRASKQLENNTHRGSAMSFFTPDVMMPLVVPFLPVKGKRLSVKKKKKQKSKDQNGHLSWYT